MVDKNLNQNKSFGFEHNDLISMLKYKKYFRNNRFDGKIMHVSGANLVIRKSIFIQAGMFDEKLFLYYEEADLTRRVLKLGFINMYYPEKRIIHLEGTSSLNIKKLDIIYESYRYFCDKYNINFDKKIRDEIFAYKIIRIVKPFYTKEKSERILYLKSLLNNERKNQL